MTTQKAVNIFKILIDKYGSPEVIDSEIVDYLNMATYEWLNRLIPDNQGGIVNFEADSNVAMQIRPLIYNLTLSLDANDKITDEKLADKLRVQVEDQNACVFRIGNIGVVVSNITYPAKYVSSNSLWVFQRNYFKKASSTKPLYTYVKDGYQFYSDPGGDIKITVIKKPSAISLTPIVVNPELDDYAMYSIIMIAVKMAGIAIRETELLQDMRLAGIQNAQ